MNQQQELIASITKVISQLEWPDLEAVRHKERQLIAEAIRRAGFGASIMSNGYNLPDWIRSGGYNSSVCRARQTVILGNGVDLELVEIPAGRFLMGSPSEEPGRYDDEGPQHQVQLQGFFMGQTPITQAQWQVVAGWQKLQRNLSSDPARFKGLHRPVESVLWEDAIEFCQRLSQHFGRTYTLPSEAQWEYACRAGTTTPFHFGATLTPELANYDGNSTYCEGPKGVWRQESTDVASFPANPWGLYDIHGNVWEWCLDQWHDNFQGAPADGSAWLDSSVNKDNKRLLRGGSWYDRPRDCRSAFRNFSRPDSRILAIGFRVCCLPR